jgi:hypothetical protein
MTRIFGSKFATGVIASLLAVVAADTASAQLACPSAGSSDRSTTSSQRSPYRTGSPFRGAIDNVQTLQFPETSECLSLDDIKAEQILRNAFYMDSSNRLNFNFTSTSKGKRLELRGNTFQRTTNNATMTFDYTLPSTASARSEGFTIGQILTEKVGNASAFPVLRLEVMKERRADGQVYTNQIFAILKSADNVGAEFIPLGPVADGGKYGSIRVVFKDSSNKLVITHTYNGSTKTASLSNVSTNSAFSPGLYFKTGCYLQDPGLCQVRYSSLSYSNVPKP